ncbi:hypothetical protein F5Y17DRAFT_353761 [Xylariaceae sp. FL0594]|nr:hypothetical protein F5Y17DRAFT_353761 [Xylariaceae sp. FL0594]
MSHPPPSSTPAKLPSSVATYTPAMQDVEMRSQINTLLLRGGHSAKIQEQFLHSLDAHPSNWPSTIQAHALSLLRSGEVTTFPTLMRRVLEDVRRDTAAALASSSAAPASTSNDSNSKEDGEKASSDSQEEGVPNGNAATTNGSGKKIGGGVGATNGNATASAATSSTTNPDGTPSLAIPTAVVESALKLVRESLDDICEVDADGGAAG